MRYIPIAPLALVSAALVAGCPTSAPPQDNGPLPSAPDPRTLPMYHITYLGSLGGDSTSALGINDRGQVVGRATDVTGAERAIFYDDNVLYDLGTLGGPTARAYGINASGQITGSADPGTPPPPDDANYESFITRGDDDTKSVLMRSLGTLGGTRSRAFALNDYGDCVGWSRLENGDFRAFLWTNETGMVNLFPSGGTGSSFAFGINNLGQVVGSSGPNDQHSQDFAFLWDNGTVTDLGNFGGAAAFAQDINDRSEVVGSAETAEESSHAFHWADGVLTDLGTLGGATSSAYGINEEGDVVGAAEDTGGNDRAVVWFEGEIFDLNTRIPSDSGWVLQTAYAVNNHVEIVGTGQFNGETRAFKLVPVN